MRTTSESTHSPRPQLCVARLRAHRAPGVNRARIAVQTRSQGPWSPVMKPPRHRLATYGLLEGGENSFIAVDLLRGRKLGSGRPARAGPCPGVRARGRAAQRRAAVGHQACKAQQLGRVCILPCCQRIFEGQNDHPKKVAPRAAIAGSQSAGQATLSDAPEPTAEEPRSAVASSKLLAWLCTNATFQHGATLLICRLEFHLACN